MPSKSVQRTLLVGLDQVGASVVDLVLANVGNLGGGPGIIQGIAILTEEMELEHGLTPLQISAGTPFEAWQAEVEQQAARTLQAISQVSHLTQLARHGVELIHSDEVHIILVANLAVGWTAQILPALMETLRRTVERMLASQASLTGVLLFVAPAGSEVSQGEEGQPNIEQWLERRLALKFERGCFVAGLTNEMGLVIGEVKQLIDRTAYFLSVLIREPNLAGNDGLDFGAVFDPAAAGWPAPWLSFGLARLEWPGRELVKGLSRRWSQEMLGQLTAPVKVEGAADLTGQARQAAQRWFIAEKLAPPLLLDRLAALMPPAPATLAAGVPDPPWPWLLPAAAAGVEQAAQTWQESWLGQRKYLEERLAEWQQAWREQAENWLPQQLGPQPTGTVLLAQSYLAAVSELLHTFLAGVSQRLAEAEADLAQVERQMSQIAERLERELAGFPASPAALLGRWGLRPRVWFSAWSRCRQAQDTARALAHLSRSRLLAWQAVNFHEQILPFYQGLLTDWQQLVATWETGCRRVLEARQLLAQPQEAAQLEAGPEALGDPWQEELGLALYQEAIERHGAQIWQQTGRLTDWVLAGLEAEDLSCRLQAETSQALAPLALTPADDLFVRQFPDKAEQSLWLESFAEQARPFWRYDEARLSESSRGQARLESWLLLPQGEQSPLAAVSQSWPHPPLILASHQLNEIVVVSIRRMLFPGSSTSLAGQQRE